MFETVSVKFPLRDATGAVHAVGGVATDITEQKKFIRALEQSEERFKLAVRGTNDGIWDWDIEKKSLYYSPRFYDLLGYHENELAGTYESLLDRVHRDDCATLLREIDALIPFA